MSSSRVEMKQGILVGEVEVAPIAQTTNAVRQEERPSLRRQALRAVLPARRQSQRRRAREPRRSGPQQLVEELIEVPGSLLLGTADVDCEIVEPVAVHAR